MIPHRASKNEIVGLVMKDRVTACRRRMRGSRSAHRIQPSEEMRDCRGEKRDAFLDGYPLVRESVSTEEVGDFSNSEAWHRDAQEVGIT
jgi:hypothetical protein